MQSTDLASNEAVGTDRVAGRRTDAGAFVDRAAAAGVNNPRAGDVAALQRLGADLVARGFQTHLVTPGDRPPHLDVVNPRVRVLTETVYFQGGCYWWGWAERIVRDADAAAAGAAVARVLRTDDD